MDRVEIWTFRVLGTPATGGGTGSGSGLGARDLAGWDVEALDGHIGKVDEADDEAGSSYLVVDTGFWIFGKKRMLPASVVERIDPDAKQVFVNLRKDEIRDAPDWDDVRAKEDDYRREVADHYAGARPASRPSSR